MQNEFKNWLLENNYKTSTSADYCRRVKRVLVKEGCNTWESLADNISKILPIYEADGEKQKEGKISHESCKNSLRAFNRFVSEQAVLVKTPINKPQPRFRLFS